MVLYRTFVLLISFYNFGTTCIFIIYGVLHLFHPWTKAKNCSRWNRVQSRSLSSPGSLLCLGICGGWKASACPRCGYTAYGRLKMTTPKVGGLIYLVWFEIVWVTQFWPLLYPSVHVKDFPWSGDSKPGIGKHYSLMDGHVLSFEKIHIVSHCHIFNHIRIYIYYIYIPSYYRSSRIQKHMTRWKVNNLKHCQCSFRHVWCWKALCGQALNEVQDASDLWQRPVKELGF